MATRTARKETAKKIEKTMDASSDMLGAICYWSLSGCNIKPDSLRALFDVAGLDQEWFPPLIKGHVAFRKALREAKRRVDAVLLRQITEDEKRIVYGVVKENVDEANEDLDYKLQARITFKKDTESVLVKGKHPLAEYIEDLYKQFNEEFIDWDIRRMLVRNIHRNMSAIALRPSGGVYFAPAHWVNEIQKHQQVVEQIGSCEMTLIKVSGDAANKKNLGRNVKRSLAEELVQVKEEIEKFKTEPPRTSTMEHRVESFQELRKKAEMYSTMLSVKVDDITTGLDDCKKILLGLISVEKKKEEEAGKKDKPAKKKKGATTTKRTRAVVKEEPEKKVAKVIKKKKAQPKRVSTIVADKKKSSVKVAKKTTTKKTTKKKRAA